MARLVSLSYRLHTFKTVVWSIVSISFDSDMEIPKSWVRTMDIPLVRPVISQNARCISINPES